MHKTFFFQEQFDTTQSNSKIIRAQYFLNKIWSLWIGFQARIAELNTIHSFKLNGQKLQIALDLWNTLFVLKNKGPTRLCLELLFFLLK